MRFKDCWGVLMKLRLQRVHYMPKELEEGILYVSDAFQTAAHLCPCGCGAKVRTPLGPTEWSFRETPLGPTLHPSIGNWQRPCKSHYWIRDGEIVWAAQWTPDEIEAGRREEESRRMAYFDDLYSRTNRNLLKKLWNWIRSRVCQEFCVNSFREFTSSYMDLSSLRSRWRVG